MERCFFFYRISDRVFSRIHIPWYSKMNKKTNAVANMFAKNRGFCKQKRPFCKHFIFCPVSDCKHGRWPLGVLQGIERGMFSVFFGIIWYFWLQSARFETRSSRLTFRQRMTLSSAIRNQLMTHSWSDHRHPDADYDDDYGDEIDIPEREPEDEDYEE